MIADAGTKNLSFAQALESLADMELESRNRRAIERRFRCSRLAAQHSIDSFHFKHHKSRMELKNRILRLLDLEFLSKGTSAILSSGVPIVAIPVGNDQPGVAARVKWLGVGESLPLKRLRADRLRTLVKRVLEQEQYRLRARRSMLEIKRTDGVRKAADLIEHVLHQQRPALRAAGVPV